MAIVAVLTLRHMASKQLVSQSAETVFNDALGYVALILAAFFMLESQLLVVENSLTTSYVHYLYDPVSSQALSGSELIEKFGSSLIIFRNTVTICTLALKAGFMAVAAGVLWNLALVQDFSFKESLATFRANALYLFAFFFVFEIIFHQLFLLYTVLVIYLPLEWPDTSISLSWRRHVVPQFVRELVWMPIHFVVTLIALSSIAEVQLFLTGRSAA